MSQCVDCKHFTGAEDYDLCCRKQVRRLTHWSSETCVQFEQETEQKEAFVDKTGLLNCPYCHIILRTSKDEFPCIAKCPRCQHDILVRKGGHEQGRDY